MTPTARPLASALALLVGLPLLLITACGPAPKLIIDTPINGTFTSDATILVSGRVESVSLPLTTVTVNGTLVPVDPGFLTWSTTVPVDMVNPVTSIVVRLTHNGADFTERRSVIYGDSVADGDFSLEAMSMRITDLGLDAMESVLGGLFSLDPATLVPVGSVLSSGCQVPGPFGTCLGSSTVTVDNPPPSITGFGIDMMPVTDAIEGDISITGLRIHIKINGSGLVPTCGLRLDSSLVSLPGSYAVSPDPLNVGIDVNQNSIGVSMQGFSQTYTSGICDVPLIGDLIQLFIGDLEDDVTTGFQDFLSDPDGAGPDDAPVAEAIEMATAGLDLDGSIGSQIGVNLEAPEFTIDEDPNGLTIGTDARITSTAIATDAPDLDASYHIDQLFPAYPVTTPVGGFAYDLGLCIGTSAFNQLLKAEIESGLMQSVLTEIDFGGGPLALTAGLLSAFIPELSSMDPAEPLELHLSPRLAPYTTGDAGPSGELATLVIPHLEINLMKTDYPLPIIKVVIDAVTGLDFGFADGQIAVTIGEVVPGSLNIDIIDNPIHTNEVVLAFVLELLMNQSLPTLADSFGGFPLPSLLGLELDFVEASKNGEFISVFLNLNPTP